MNQPRRAGVLGRPIAHSLSPVLHRAAYRELGLAWRYDAIDCGVQELAATLRDRAHWAGFSCTMPLKHAALELADEVRPNAHAAGAANTLLPMAGGGWAADNTDVTGVVAALGERRPAPLTATVLGAGGTAQAVVVALYELGLRRCVVAVRDQRRATGLLETAAGVGVEVTLTALGVDSASLAADLVVSTLPSGAADPLAGRAWSAGQTVFDVSYDPWPTALSTAAAKAGATVICGRELLLHQAAAQVELMTGRPAPLEAMRSALAAAAPAAAP